MRLRVRMCVGSEVSKSASECGVRLRGRVHSGPIRTLLPTTERAAIQVSFSLSFQRQAGLQLLEPFVGHLYFFCLRRDLGRKQMNLGIVFGFRRVRTLRCSVLSRWLAALSLTHKLAALFRSKKICGEHEESERKWNNEEKKKIAGLHAGEALLLYVVLRAQLKSLPAQTTGAMTDQVKRMSVAHWLANLSERETKTKRGKSEQPTPVCAHGCMCVAP